MSIDSLLYKNTFGEPNMMEVSIAASATMDAAVAPRFMNYEEKAGSAMVGQGLKKIAPPDGVQHIILRSLPQVALKRIRLETIGPDLADSGQEKMAPLRTR